MAASRETTQIELPPLNLEIIEVTLFGDTPLISHAWSEKAKREMLGKQMKVAKPAKEAKDPHEDFQQSLYRIEGGGYGFPSVAFKAAAVTACTSVAGITKVAARQAFHVVGEQSAVRGAVNGALMRMDLVRILGSATRDARGHGADRHGHRRHSLPRTVLALARHGPGALQRQHAAVGPLARGGENDELRIGKLGHGVGSLVVGPRPSQPFYCFEPRLRLAARGGSEPRDVRRLRT